MKPKKSYFVISYDISDNKRLAKIAKIMTKYTTRVLYSIFEGELTHEQERAVKSEVKRLLLPEEDSVIYFKLCTECADEIRTLGMKVPIQRDENFIIV
ncbi:MAG: CRISPR-associated endonuclease Cas2 [Dissulfuribacterales bacterium]